MKMEKWKKVYNDFVVVDKSELRGFIEATSSLDNSMSIYRIKTDKHKKYLIRCRYMYEYSLVDSIPLQGHTPSGMDVPDGVRMTASARKVWNQYNFHLTENTFYYVDRPSNSIVSDDLEFLWKGRYNDYKFLLNTPFDIEISKLSDIKWSQFAGKELKI